MGNRIRLTVLFGVIREFFHSGVFLKMKRSDLVFATLLIPIDFCMIVAAGLAAYFLRFGTLSTIRPVILEIPFSHYLGWTTAVACFYIVVFAASGLYRIGYQRIHNEVQKISTACSASIMLVIVFIFLQKELFTSRFIVLAAWLLSIVFVCMGRGALRGIRTLLFRKAIGLHPIAVIGSKEYAEGFMREITAKPTRGYRISAYYPSFSEGMASDFEKIIREQHIQEILVIDPMLSRELLQHILDFATLQHIALRYAADRIGSQQLVIGMVAGTPLIEIKRTKLEGWGKILKRLFDVIASSILLVVLAPLFLIITLLVWWDSRGPIIYKNIRVGQRGLFPTYKFRSMFVEYCTGPGYDATGTAEALQDKLITTQNERKGPVPKVLHDPRRTRMGRILERTSFDELPQLFNVLMGNMSLVGPRPHMPREVAGYENDHHKLFSVKPGVTGLAQISGRSDLDFDEEARLDIFYIEHWSLLFDIIIVLKTPFAILNRKSRV